MRHFTTTIEKEFISRDYDQFCSVAPYRRATLDADEMMDLVDCMLTIVSKKSAIL